MIWPIQEMYLKKTPGLSYCPSYWSIMVKYDNQNVVWDIFGTYFSARRAFLSAKETYRYCKPYMDSVQLLRNP